MYWITGFLGVFLMTTPYIFNYADNMMALVTSVIVGSIVVLASLAEWVVSSRDDMKYWIVEFSGVFVLMAPFILGFSTHVSAMWSSVLMGAIITLVAGSILVLYQTHKT